MLRATYPAIKEADPTARVVLGGLSLNDHAFLQQLYSAGAAPFFDIAAVHPYTGSVDPAQCWNQSGTTRYAKEAFCGIVEVRKTMLANGDSSELWLIEMSWSTANAPNGVSGGNPGDLPHQGVQPAVSHPGFDAVLVPWPSGLEKETVFHGSSPEVFR